MCSYAWSEHSHVSYLATPTAARVLVHQYTCRTLFPPFHKVFWYNHRYSDSLKIWLAHETTTHWHLQNLLKPHLLHSA